MARFLAKVGERMALGCHAATKRLEWFERWTRSKALGVPLGADIAGDEWEEPTLLPFAPDPPPIPPNAFFQVRPEEDWGAAILAAKHGVTPAPTSSGAPGAAFLAAMEGNDPAAQAPAPAARPRPAPKLAAPRPVAPRPAPKPSALPAKEPRIGPKAVVGPLAIEPHITLETGSPLAGPSDDGPRPRPGPVDPQVAAAARKAIKAALRM